MRIDRRVAIADAAITVIARDGVRALTHRALDRELDLPAGSSSYYLRTRRDLLAATVDRLAQRTVADLLEPAERRGTSDGAARTMADPNERLSEALAALLVHSIENRADDHRARFALAAELVGDPALHAMVTWQSPIRRRLLAGAIGALAAVGVTDPEARAPALVALADGILHDRLVGSRAFITETRAQRLADVQRTLADYLRGAAGDVPRPT